MKKRILVGLVTGALMLSMAELASANLISNGSFEMGSFSNYYGNASSLPVGSTNITDWTVVNGEISRSNTPNFWGLTASDGAFFLDLTGFHDHSPYGGVSQTITTITGQNYKFSLDLENPYDYNPISVLASVGNDTHTFTLNAGGPWQTFSFDFVANTYKTPISIIGTEGLYYIGLDNVSVNATTAPVPEPATMLLFGTGLVGLVGARIKKKKI